MYRIPNIYLNYIISIEKHFDAELHHESVQKNTWEGQCANLWDLFFENMEIHIECSFENHNWQKYLQDSVLNIK